MHVPAFLQFELSARDKKLQYLILCNNMIYIIV